MSNFDLSLNDYQKAACRTISSTATQHNNLANFALGLSGEAGEVGDHVKKYLFHGHEMDREDLLKELGDVLWYVAGLATALNFELEDVANANIKKLQKRYPRGFNEADSVARVDEAWKLNG